MLDQYARLFMAKFQIQERTQKKFQYLIHYTLSITKWSKRIVLNSLSFNFPAIRIEKQRMIKIKMLKNYSRNYSFLLKIYYFHKLCFIFQTQKFFLIFQILNKSFHENYNDSFHHTLSQSSYWICFAVLISFAARG